MKVALNTNKHHIIEVNWTQKKYVLFPRKFQLHLNYYKQEVKDIIHPLKIKTDKFVRNYIELIIWLFNVFKLSIYNFSYKSFEGVHRIIGYFVLSVIITIYLWSHRVILTVSTNWYWNLLVSVTSSTLMFLIKTIMSALKAPKKCVFPIAWSSKLGSVGRDFLFFLLFFFWNLQVCSFL